MIFHFNNRISSLIMNKIFFIWTKVLIYILKLEQIEILTDTVKRQ